MHHLSDEASEECEALSSIYGDDCDIDIDEGNVVVYVPSRDSFPKVVLRAHLPHAYPESQPPLVELHMPRHVPDEMVIWASDKILEMFVPGAI